jgi:hypothetical protein
MALDNALGMTDEEFLKQDLSMLEEELDQELEAQETNQIDEADGEQTLEAESNEDTTEEVVSESNTDESDEDDSVDEVTDPIEDTLSEDETTNDDTSTESQDTDVTANTETSDILEDTQESPGVDFEGAYKRIMSPFKASKRMMKVDTVDDAISLMQKGADYNQKMQALNPNLKIVSMLEKEGLLDTAKLNNLIDLSKKNPQAIAKLIKDSGIDPLDIDTDEEVEYKPTDYGVSDMEFKINQALDSIKDSPSFDKTLNVLSKEWDNESKKLISENPEIIGIINDHVYNGVYDKVQSIIDSERAVGRLANVPDVVAYRQVAEYLQHQGSLVNEGHVNQQPQASVPQTKANEVDTAKLNQKRKAAGSTKKTASKKTSSTPDYLKMTDDEFMKMAASG